MISRETVELNRSAASDTPQAGSIEERDALDAIDQARFEEMYPQSAARTKRRLRRHWSDREHALGN